MIVSVTGFWFSADLLDKKYCIMWCPNREILQRNVKKLPQFGKLFRACPNAISQSVVISLQYSVSTLQGTVTSNPHMNSIAFTLCIWEVICSHYPVDYVLSSDSRGQETRTTQPHQAQQVQQLHNKHSSWWHDFLASALDQLGKIPQAHRSNVLWVLLDLGFYTLQICKLFFCLKNWLSLLRAQISSMTCALQGCEELDYVHWKKISFY